MTLTVAQFVADWKSGRGSRRVSRGWETDRRRLLQKLVRLHGGCELAHICADHIWDAQDAARDAGLAGATINRLSAACLAMIRDAEAQGLVPAGVHSEIRAKVHFEKESPENRFQPFSQRERDSIITTMAETAEHYVPLVSFQFYSGLRVSEALGLQWQDINLARGSCRIRRSRRGHLVEPCKTRRSKREIPLAAAAKAALGRLPRLANDDWVFLSVQGKPIQESNFCRRVWHPTLKVAKVPNLAFRCTRHTFASLAIENGWLPADVAAYVGDRVDTVLRHYVSYTKAFADCDPDKAVNAPGLRLVKSR